MNANNVPVIATILIVLLATLALSGCASPMPTAAPTATPVPGQVVMTINGSVSTPLALTLAVLRAMPQQPVNASYVTNNQTMYVTGSGPLLNDLLGHAGVSSSATNITFLASDGYTKTVTLSTVKGTVNATILILSDGSLRDVIPGQASNTWVGNLTAITIS